MKMVKNDKIVSDKNMFVLLSKFLPLFFYPLGLVCILLVAALFLRKKERTRNTLIAVSIGILWLSGTALVSNNLARSLEWRYLPPKEIPSADVIVVLGGGTDASVYPRSGVEINGAGDRVLYAARIYKEGKAANLLLSGGEITWMNATSSTPADEMAEILQSVGIPKEALWLEDKSQNTYENAIFSKIILDAKGIKKILLITSATHMPRAVALFQKLGLEVVPLPVDYSVTLADISWNEQDWLGQVLGLLPSTGNLSATTNALKEYFGIFTYWLRGWL
jgi:uncharacterized SAM-binding protein YcdF (DUF218 family)